VFKVVFTDGQIHTGLEAWIQPVKAAGGELTIHRCTTAEQVEHACRGADAVLNAGVKVSAAAIAAMPNCRVIARLGAGYDNVDIPAATAAGIPVTNTPGFCDHEVADHVMALLLACARQIPMGDRIVRQGKWERFYMMPAFRLNGRVMGLVGLGRIGLQVAQRALGFGMKVIFFDPFVTGNINALAQRCETLEELLKQADVVSLHTPLTPQTQGLMGAKQFQLMKPTSYLINCARGPVVVEADLIQALKQGSIARAGLDVFDPEPPKADNELFSMDNVVLSPHCAAHTVDALEELRQRGFAEAIRALRHEPLKHVVNPQALSAAKKG
jgi:D-3-phosphoglycerate dehydrogenase